MIAAATGDLVQRFLRVGYGIPPLEKDALDYWRLSEQMARGDWLLSDPIQLQRPPLYPAFLGTMQFFGGGFGILFSSCIQQAFGFAANLFVAWAVFRFSGNIRAASIACVLLVLPAAPSFFGTRILSEALFLPFLSIFFSAYLVSLRSDSRNDFWAAVAGIALGCSALVRGIPHFLAGILFLPAIIEVVRHRKVTHAVRQHMRVAAVVCLLTLCMITPWMLRGYFLTGRPILTYTAGFQLWRSVFLWASLDYPDSEIAADTKKRVLANTIQDPRAGYPVQEALIKSGLSANETQDRMFEIAREAVCAQPLKFTVSVFERALRYMHYTCKGEVLNRQGKEATAPPYRDSEQRMFRCWLMPTGLWFSA